MIDLNAATLKDIVTQDFRAAAVFERYSLDFCCRGGMTIDEACKAKGVIKDLVIAEVHGLAPRQGAGEESYETTALDALIGHIVTTHHTYVRTMIPVLGAHTQKVATVHGPNHPEVIEIAAGFARVAEELQHHMMKEEGVLFPYIIALAGAAQAKNPIHRPPFGSARNPIRMMEAEHRAAGDELYEIRGLSSGYAPPPDACTTFKVTYQELQEFERDLHRHVHLENNILFPKAIALEDRLLSTA